jgi:hypothetical protein
MPLSPALPGGRLILKALAEPIELLHPLSIAFAMARR